MDPAPTANPHAQLVSECFEDCPALDTPARNRSPTTPPDLKPVKGSEWDGVRRPAVDIEESHSREGKVAVVYYDEGCEEGNMPAGSRSWLPSLTGQSGDQGQQTYFVKNMTKLNLVGDCTLPGLKELGLDMYVEKRD